MNPKQKLQESGRKFFRMLMVLVKPRIKTKDFNMLYELFYDFVENVETRRGNNTMQVKLLSDDAKKPRRVNQDAGFDIYAAETIYLEPQEKAIVKTDVAVNIPEGFVGLLTSRSGVSSKTNLVIETGKIDSGYHGNLGINIKNDSDIAMHDDVKAVLHDKNAYALRDIANVRAGFSNTKHTYKIRKGDKLAQLVIVSIWTPALDVVDEFDTESARGNKGFGSSGY